MNLSMKTMGPRFGALVEVEQIVKEEIDDEYRQWWCNKVEPGQRAVMISFGFHNPTEVESAQHDDCSYSETRMVIADGQELGILERGERLLRSGKEVPYFLEWFRREIAQIQYACSNLQFDWLTPPLTNQTAFRNFVRVFPGAAMSLEA